MRGVALVAIIFGCVVLHELGHALVAQRSGVAVRSIILLPIGGVTLMEDIGQRNADPARDIRIAVAGPLVNLAIAAVSGVFILMFLPQVKLWAHPFVHAGNLPRALFWGNVFLGGFNLLPAYPMDGGRVLRALSCRAHGLRARHPPRRHRRPGLRHAVYLPRRVERLADADRLLPLRGRAAGRPLGGLSSRCWRACAWKT